MLGLARSTLSDYPTDHKIATATWSPHVAGPSLSFATGSWDEHVYSSFFTTKEKQTYTDRDVLDQSHRTAYLSCPAALCARHRAALSLRHGDDRVRGTRRRRDRLAFHLGRGAPIDV